MTAAPIPRLPNPLTPETIEELMKARPYWDTSHPRSPIYRRLVQRGFEIMYPHTRYDAIGRMIDMKPLKPQYIAHLVAKENEDIESEFGERARAGESPRALNVALLSGRADGAVHVQSHSRDGGKVEVGDYWRSRPGEGSGSESTPESPKARNLLDDAENAEGADDIPEIGSPVSGPRVRGRDGYGSGEFGANREGGRTHTGIDLVTTPDEIIKSPVAGQVETRSPSNSRYNNGDWIEPYPDDPEKSGQLKGVGIITNDGHRARILYVDPDAVGLRPGQRVEIGDPIGKAQDLSTVYPPNKEGTMTNHIHFDVSKDGKFKDPSNAVLDNQGKSEENNPPR